MYRARSRDGRGAGSIPGGMGPPRCHKLLLRHDLGCSNGSALFQAAVLFTCCCHAVYAVKIAPKQRTNTARGAYRLVAVRSARTRARCAAADCCSRLMRV